jgi:hypothetical protein
VLVVRRHRLTSTIDRIVAVALMNLLLLGIWLPIGATLWCRIVPGWAAKGEIDVFWTSNITPLTIFLLLPPLVAAVALTQRRISRYTVVVIAVLFAMAIACRVSAPSIQLYVYQHFVPSLVGAAIAAAFGVASLAIATYQIRERLARRTSTEREGIIVDDGEPTVASIEVTSWIRGPQIRTSRFGVRTRHGTLAMPPGAEIVHAIPRLTRLSHRGDDIAILQPGDRVFVDGFIDSHGGHPFRGTIAPQPGPRVVVRPADPACRPQIDDMLLTAWRPSLAYLVIVALAAVPALAALPKSERLVEERCRWGDCEEPRPFILFGQRLN